MDKQKKAYVKPEILVEEWKVYKEVTSKSRWGHRIYEVSNFGRVKINGVITEPHIGYNGYKFIGCFNIHRAVAELFVPNPENKPFVDHIDTNQLNNMAPNLRWVTNKENMNNPLTKKHFSDIRKGTNKGAKNPFYGKHHTKETRHKLSESHKDKSHPSSIKGKHRVYNDPNNYNLGYHYE